MSGSLFPPKDIPNTLGEVVANAGLTQLRTAETEKCATCHAYLDTPY